MWVSVLALSLLVILPIESKSLQPRIDEQKFHTILALIENRLQKLDTIYTVHQFTTMEKQFQQKLEVIEAKMNRLESLVTLNLEKISENISLKTSQDDTDKAKLTKKIDANYGQFIERFEYLDQKLDENFNAIQLQTESSLARIRNVEDLFIKNNNGIEKKLSHAITAFDNFKQSCTMSEENIVNNTNENFEIALNEHTNLIKSYNDKTNKVIENLFNNTFKKVQITESNKNEIINRTEHILKSMKIDLNDYAVKVAEMNSENWKTGKILTEKQDILENLVKFTKKDIQNEIRALVMLGRIPANNNITEILFPFNQLSKKMEDSFEKVFSAQKVFMESCYRLQMDESQIESKISDVLQKLIETFDKKSTEIKDITKLERLIKHQDYHIRRNIFKHNANVVTFFEKLFKHHQQFESKLMYVADLLETFFASVDKTDEWNVNNNSSSNFAY